MQGGICWTNCIQQCICVCALDERHSSFFSTKTHFQYRLPCSHVNHGSRNDVGHNLCLLALTGICSTQFVAEPGKHTLLRSHTYVCIISLGHCCTQLRSFHDGRQLAKSESHRSGYDKLCRGPQKSACWQPDNFIQVSGCHNFYQGLRSIPDHLDLLLAKPACMNTVNSTRGHSLQYMAAEHTWR